MTQMTQVDVTLVRAIKVCWSLTWRLTVFVAAPLAALGTAAVRGWGEGLFAADGPLATAGVPPELIIAASLAAGAALVIVMPVCIVRRVLRQAWSDFRIVLEGPPRRLRIEPQLDATVERSRGRPKPRKRIEPILDVDAGRRAVAGA